jgi:hypothetical protein
MNNIEIDINDLILRTLDFSNDLQNYFYWMSHREDNEYIPSAKKSYPLADLQDLIKESAKWLNINSSMKTMFLGVDQNNSAAITLYSKVGFIPENNQLQNGIKMRWDLNVK